MRKYRRWLVLVAGVILVGCLLWGGAAAKRMLRPETILRQSSPVIHHVAAEEIVTRQVTAGPFSLAVPSDWQAVPPLATPAPSYRWHGTGSVDTARWVDLYIDTTPSALAVNRLLPVEASGDRLEVTGTVSENCSSFTNQSSQSVASGAAPSSWNGVDFLCDMGNYERDVVAIGVPDSINSVDLAGPRTGHHRVLLTYTDNSSNPDYTLFAAMVRSLQAQ